MQQFAGYFVFFYSGYVFAPFVFRLAEWAQRNRLQAAGMLAVWAVANGLLVYSPGHAVLPPHTQMGFAAFLPRWFAATTGGYMAHIPGSGGAPNIDFKRPAIDLPSAGMPRWLSCAS